MIVNKRRAVQVFIALIVTFAVLRIYLLISPNTNLDVGPYNIHHLFTGVLLLVFAGIPLVLFHGNSRGLDLSAIFFGIGIGMVLDEWVFLIATDGSDASYLLPISFWGAVVMLILISVYIAGLLLYAVRSGSAAKPVNTDTQ